jgi:hypothetical protein
MKLSVSVEVPKNQHSKRARYYRHRPHLVAALLVAYQQVLTPTACID